MPDTEMQGIGQIGYVANSPYTVLGESMSAGRIYDKIGDEAVGTVMYVLPKGVLCKLNVAERFDGDKLPGTIQNNDNLPGSVNYRPE